MTTTSSSRRQNSAAVGKKTVTSDIHANVAMSTGARERATEIGKTISEAMQKLSDIDWTRESPAITEAQAQLDEQVTLYCENKASKRDVKWTYQAWVNAHRGGLF